MAKTVNEYKTEIIKVLKAHRLYSKGLDMQVLSLASAMRNLEMANEQIDGLTAEDLAGEVEDDPLVDITKKLTKKRKQPKIIKPGTTE